MQRPPEPTIDPSNPSVLRWDDLGLVLVHDFISDDEEDAMITAFHAHEQEAAAIREGGGGGERGGRETERRPKAHDKKNSKRLSQHFGHHFDYTTFGASEARFTPVPPYIAALLPRLPIQAYLPDQFTVQYYPPGTGIPPHVDTHSMFAEALYSLSFGSAVPMQFRLSGPNDARKMRLPKRSSSSPPVATTTTTTTTQAVPDSQASQTAPNDQQQQEPTWELLLPARSLLLMTGPSRYGYTHAIRPRKTDLVGGATVPRRGRYSITMRTVRRGDEIGCDCAYPGVCDARVREEQAAAVAEEEAREAQEAAAAGAGEGSGSAAGTARG